MRIDKLYRFLRFIGAKRKSVVVIALLGFWAGYVVITMTQNYILVKDVMDQDNIRRFRNIDIQLDMAAPLLATGEIDALIANLKNAERTREFDFYILKNGEQALSFYNPGYTLEQTDREEFPMGQWRSNDGKIQGITIKVGDYSFVIGISSRGSEQAIRFISKQRAILIQDVAMVTAFFFALIYFVLKDILDLSRVLRGRQRHKAKFIQVRSQEAETLLAVTTQYEDVNQGLKLTNQTYAESLSPAIHYELDQRTQVPHLFPAIVVRIDINGYTQMVLDRKDEFVTSTLNTYFQRASEVIRRFGGHVYQYVGDEIVFHFKELETENAFTMAVNCVRCLFDVAKEINDELKQHEVPFVIKGSISRGRLRFIKLDSGYAFSGLPLIESVRMLGKIEERDENILAIYADDEVGVKNVVKPFKKLKVSFKGFRGQTEIIEIKSFANLDDALNEEPVNALSYFRSDQDIVHILNHMRVNIRGWSKEKILFFYKTLLAIPITQIGGRVEAQYSMLLAEVDSWNESSGNSVASLVALGTMTNLGAHLLRTGAFNQKLRDILEKNLKHPDQRIRGNTVITLDELSPETYSFKEMFAQPFNRAAADALLAEGRREVTEEVFTFLEDFLHAKDPFFVASGLYVLAELYDHHRSLDPVYFHANEHIQKIPGLIEMHINSDNPMVQKRAQLSWALVNKKSLEAAA